MKEEKETRAEITPGIYEEVLNEQLSKELRDIQDNRKYLENIDPAEAASILAAYAARAIESKLNQLDDLNAQIESVNSLLEDLNLSKIDPAGKQLLGILDDKDIYSAGKKAKDIPRPQSSMSKSSLFTASGNEPPVYAEFRQEIVTCQRIDMLVSFIRWSGLRRIIRELETFTSRGGKLRVATTAYMGATEVKAIEELAKLENTEIKISYDTKRTRLHAKAYIFLRNTGYDTAYVGSSNLSGAAISSGLEWNTKITRQDLPEAMDKIQGSFETYWNSDEFEEYNNDSWKLQQALAAEKNKSIDNGTGAGSSSGEVWLPDLRPYPYQEKILDQLQAQRQIHHCCRNLVVAATGTGKTVLAAFDYARYAYNRRNEKSSQNHARLLFVAHRKEILEQSLQTFRAVLKDPNFGDVCYGGNIPDQVDHVFASIQTINAKDFTKRLCSDFYDYIIVDEFHHACAPSYETLLEYFKPEILLGLTATPERMDGKNVLEAFDGRIAAEIRLPEAVERRLLVPFDYFGISDPVSLENVSWNNGKYSPVALSKLYTGNISRASWVLESVKRYTSDINSIIGLGFCVSIEHAEFMADYFNQCGVPSIALSSNSSPEERDSARSRLISGEIKFIFSVNLYNEGVDIPQINTVLFLRPTESLTVFLQQLGRGLRLYPGKECLTVLDFIGQAHKKYRFEQKFQALLSNPANNITAQIQQGFTAVPKGCCIQLEKIAQKYILDNIRQAVITKKSLPGYIREYYERTGNIPGLKDILESLHLEPADVYKVGTYSRLKNLAGLEPDFSEPLEKEMAKALIKFSFTDSPGFIEYMRDLIRHPKLPENDLEAKYLSMFGWTIHPQSEADYEILMEEIEENPIVMSDLAELLDYVYEKISFVPQRYDQIPLDIGATYTREQLFSALGYEKPNQIREGVKYLPEIKTDILLVTLNKSEKEYSPTTLYQDYSINEKLFHWQSQSTTSDQSNTGQRYIHHDSLNSKVLLFVREFKTLNKYAVAMPYTFLGPVHYVSHTGSKPMNILWELEHPIPARYLPKTSKLS